MTEESRPAALLTQTQRDTLRGEYDSTDDAQRKMMNRIKERVAMSVSDLALFVEHAPDAQIEKTVARLEHGTLRDAVEAIHKLDDRKREQLADDRTKKSQRMDELEERLDALESSISVLADAFQAVEQDTETDTNEHDS